MSRIANGYLSFALRALAFIVANGLLIGTRALAADDAAVGLIEAATGVVSITRAGGAPGIAGAGQALRRGETVHTERDSTVRLRFSDGSDVVLRPNSQVRVDDYTFDPLRPQSDNFALRLFKGGLRSITGAIAKRNRDRVSYSTITATIGIRGTDFMMRLCDDDCAREETTAGGTRLPDPAVARVGALSGGVSALRPDGRWRALDAGDAVYPDDAIVTGAAGVAVLFFVDDTRITLQPRSILVVEDYAYDAGAPARGGAVLVLLDGAARTQTGALAKADAERFVFLTPERRIRVHGTVFDTVVAVVTGTAENAGEQAEQAAQQAQDAAKKAADKAADAAQQATGDTAVQLQKASTGVEQGQSAASGVIAKVNQAAEEAIQNPPPVETTPTPSGTGQTIPVPTADIDIGRAAGQIGGGVVGAVRDAGTAVVETWREVAGAGSGAAGEVRDASTRFVERTVTWTGGRISGAIDRGVAAGESGVAAGGRTVDYVYDAAGRVVAVGRGVADTGSAAARDAIGAAATATDRALAAVIPAIIGVARDAADATDIGERGTRVIGSVRDKTEGVVTTTTATAVAVVAVTAAEIAARGRQGEQLLEQAAALGASVVLENGVYVIVFPATMWARVPLALMAAAVTTVQGMPTILRALAMLAREAGMGVAASALDETAASTEFFIEYSGVDFVATSIQSAFAVLGAIDSRDVPAVARAIRTVIEAGGTAVDARTRAVIEAAVATRAGVQPASASSGDGGKGSATDTAREQTGGGKNAPGAPPQIARFSGETAAQRPAEPEGKGSGGTAGEEDLGGGRSPPPPSGVTSQRTGDNARQVTAATSAERSTAAAGSAGDKSAPGAPPQIARFSGETAGQRPVEPDGKGSGTVREETGGGKAPPPPSGQTSQRTGATARQTMAATSAERGSAVAGTGGGMSVTAVQVYDGAVTVVDTTGEMAVRRGSLAMAIGSPATKVRFDGMVTNTAPNPGSFMVSGPLFGATTGDAPAAGLYTLVRSGQISMTQAGRDILLGPGEAGYTDDKGGAPARLRDIPRFLDGDRYLAAVVEPSLMMCRPAIGRAGDPQVRGSSVRGAEVSAAIVAGAASASAGSRGLPGSTAAPTDNAGYRDLVGAENYAATRAMSGAARAKYWGGLDPGDLGSRVQVTGESIGAGMGGDGFGVRGVGPTSGSFGEPAGGFAGGNRPGRRGAAGIEDTDKWIGGQRYGGTFGADRSGLTRSGDIAIGAGDGTGNFRGSGSGNVAFGRSTKEGNPLGLVYMPAQEAGGPPQGIPYPGVGGSLPATVGLGMYFSEPQPFTSSPGNDAGTSRGVASGIAMEAAKVKQVKLKRERDDDLGGDGVVVVLNRADAGQMANAIRRWIGAITGAAGGAGDGRTDQQSTTGGGPMMMDRGAQADAKRGGGAAGTLNQDAVFRINQLVNPGAQ